MLMRIALLRCPKILGHVKSFLRRATARNALGMHRAALIDLKEALALDAKSKKIRAELRKTKELIKASVRRAPKVNVPITIIDDDGRHTGTVEKAAEEIKVSAGSLETTPGVEAESVRGAASGAKKETQKVTSGSSAVARAISIARSAASSMTIPKTYYEFRRAWKSLAADSVMQHDYITSTLTPKRLAKLVAKNNIEAEDLMEYVECLDANAEALEPKATVQVLRALAKAKSFDMTVMFMSERDLGVFARTFDALEQRAPDSVPATLRRAYRV